MDKKAALASGHVRVPYPNSLTLNGRAFVAQEMRNHDLQHRPIHAHSFSLGRTSRDRQCCKLKPSQSFSVLFCGWVGCQGNVSAKRCASLKIILQDVTPSTPGVSVLEGSSRNVRSRIGPASQACAKAAIIAWLVTQFGYQPVISGLKANLFAGKRAILGVMRRAGVLHPHRLVPMHGAEGLCS